MKIINLSAEPEGKLRSWLPPNLNAEKVVFLPDACPGAAPLPTGTATLLRRPDWRVYAVSDVGCGMRLVRSELAPAELSRSRWNQVADLLRENKGKPGDLGSGNHFLDALESYGDSRLHFLIHTGSRSESGLVDGLVASPERFDREYLRVTEWARDNRGAVQEALEKVFGRMECLLDLAHNSFEACADGAVILRKGAVRVEPGDLAVLPSHMGGDVALIRAGDKVGEILGSMSHGTGRLMPRGDSKRFSASFDFAGLRRRVLIADGIQDSSLNTEGPYAYRDLDACLELVRDYVTVTDRFSIIAYIGHL